MANPKKNISKQKVYEDLNGVHVVSPDGSHVKIGGATFRRTVLPSVTAPRAEDAKLNTDLEEIDNQTFQEVED